MSSEKRRILDLLAQGRISADEAERLLAAVDGPEAAPEAEQTEGIGRKPRFFCVKVDARNGKSLGHGRHREHVNIKIPLALMKAGVKLSSVLPGSARKHVEGHLGEHGLDLKKLDIEELIKVLQETSIDIEDEDETVKIYCC
ncbi:hypothetical protein GF356_05615 [candidate division GN15 bacterium]|nr:hypothetical protein [candidate division GN15 bacterium]